MSEGLIECLIHKHKSVGKTSIGHSKYSNCKVTYEITNEEE